MADFLCALSPALGDQISDVRPMPFSPTDTLGLAQPLCLL